MMTRTPRPASSFATATRSWSKNCASSMPTTSVSGSTRAMSFETALVAAFAPFYNARLYA